MNISESWGRVAGFAIDQNQSAAAVWLATENHHDITLYDSCVFGDMPLERIAEALRVRGKEVAIAWEIGSKAVADELLYEGCAHMVSDPVTEDEGMAAMLSRDLADRIAAGRFVVGDREAEWKREYDGWRRLGGVAQTPLLRASRLALARLSYARPKRRKVGQYRSNHMNISMI